jgi:hypothetical protein
MMRRFSPYVADVASLALLGLLLHLVPMVSNVAGYNGYSGGIINAHRFLLASRELFDSVTLVTSEPADILNLNRRPEIALPPTGAVPAYIFPFLTALNGTDFRVVDKAQYCSAAARPGDLALLPLTVVGPGDPMEVWGHRVLRRIRRYGFAFDRSKYSEFLSTGIVPVGDEDVEPAAFGEHAFVPLDPSVLVLQRLEGDTESYRFVSRSSTLDLRPAGHSGADIVFTQEPAIDPPFKTITLDYVRPVRRRVITRDPSKGFDVAFALLNLTAIRVEMAKEAYSPDFKAHVFTIRKPVMRVLRAPPEGAGREPFSMCR